VLSIIIPAHNEAVVIGETLAILKRSAEQLGEPHEIIVVDDSSTDSTASIARAAGARVLSIERRHIAAARNAGARSARGNILVFIDADTHVSVDTLRSALAAIRDGAVGGGARMRLDRAVPRWGVGMLVVIVLILRAARWAAGCFMFVRRDAFEAVGGFDERYYATEEIVLSRALKGRGRMVIVPEPVITSGRKWRIFTFGQALRQLGTLMRGRGTLRRRETLWMWYGGDREK
jgi:glycosyltransferase involved in cell wall biosynthesis